MAIRSILLLALCSSLVMSEPALAASRTFVQSGACSQSRFGREAIDCRKIIIHLGDANRMIVEAHGHASGMTLEGTFAPFAKPGSGGILTLRSVTDSAGNDELPAKGRCLWRMNETLGKIQDVICRATFKGGNATVHFKGDGSAFEVKPGPEL